MRKPIGLIFALLLASLAWYRLFPHSATTRDLLEHPTRHNNRMVRLSGMLLSSGDDSYLGFTQPALNDFSIPIGVEFSPHLLASRQTKSAISELGLAARADRLVQVKGIRHRESPATVVGWLTYSDRACFSTGLTVVVLYATLPSGNIIAHKAGGSTP